MGYQQPIKPSGGTNVLNKYDATTAPSTNNDTTEGYSVGSVWIDVTADERYVCLDASEGAAVWALSTVGTAAEIVFTPAGDIASSDVQAAIEELDQEKVPVGQVATTSQSGIIEIATSSEINTGTDNTRAITPDAFVESEFGKQPVFMAVTSPLSDAATGDGQAYFRVPSRITGMNLVSVRLTASTPSTSGAITVQLRRSRRTDATTRANADMLSTALTLDANEYDSSDAATAAVINTSNDDVVTGDYIFADVDGVGTGSKGLGVLMVFQLP